MERYSRFPSSEMTISSRDASTTSGKYGNGAFSVNFSNNDKLHNALGVLPLHAHFTNLFGNINEYNDTFHIINYGNGPGTNSSGEIGGSTTSASITLMMDLSGNFRSSLSCGPMTHTQVTGDNLATTLNLSRAGVTHTGVPEFQFVNNKFTIRYASTNYSSFMRIVATSDFFDLIGWRGTTFDPVNSTLIPNKITFPAVAESALLVSRLPKITNVVYQYVDIPNQNQLNADGSVTTHDARVGPNLVNLSGTQFVNILSEEIAAGNHITPHGVYSGLLRIPLHDTVYGNSTTNTHINNMSQVIDLNGKKDLKEHHIRIVDEKYRPLVYPSNYHLDVKVKIFYDDTML